MIQAIDPNTGAATIIDEIGFGFAGLAFDDNGTLYAISGDGGVGKTRLAAEFAESLREKGWGAGFQQMNVKKDLIQKTNATLLKLL